MPYFAGVDYAMGGLGGQGGHKASTKGKRDGDDFAVFTLSAGVIGQVQIVHGLRRSGIEHGQASAEIHKLHRAFRYERIILDAGGGGAGVRDELRKPEQDTGDERFMVQPIIAEDDTLLIGMGQQVLSFFRQADPWIGRAGVTYKSESVQLTRAHEILRTAIEKNELVAPAPWTGWDCALNADAMRDFLNEHHGLTPEDEARAEIDLCLAQLLNVDRKQDKDGMIIQDKTGGFAWGSKHKKDSAYALVYAYFGVWIWRQLQATQRQSEPKRELQLTVMDLPGMGE